MECELEDLGGDVGRYQGSLELETEAVILFLKGLQIFDRGEIFSAARVDSVADMQLMNKNCLCKAFSSSSRCANR